MCCEGAGKVGGCFFDTAMPCHHSACCCCSSVSASEWAARGVLTLNAPMSWLTIERVCVVE
jgi:hypothetical protein